MKRLIISVVVFFVARMLANGGLGMLGVHRAGILGTILGLVAAIVIFVRMGARKEGAGGEAIQGRPAGNATFSWKGVSVYGDEGYFTHRGRKYSLDKVSRVSYETTGYQGCLGGTYYSIHIHMNDLATPRVTVGAGNLTANGNRGTEENYERLCLALGFRN